MTPLLVQRGRHIANGTLQCASYAMQYGVAMNIAGGTHHSFADHGEGFCIYNDIALSAHNLLAAGKIKKALVVDLDVHQGNGTAKIFQNNPNVFTFSTHGKTNYPFKKEKSDLDIPLEKGTGDADYLSILKKTLPKLIENEKPDFIFYLCGVDVIATDKLGTLGMTVAGCKRRDEFVLETCHQHQIPVQCSMGGGYSPNIKTIVDAHANTFRTAQRIYF